MARGIKTIVQQIRLQGAREVRAQLASILVTAEAVATAFDRPIVNNGIAGLGRSFAGLTPVVNRFSRDIRSVRSEMLQLRFQMIDAAAVTVALASAFPVALGAALGFANQTVNKFNEIQRAARDLRVPVSVYNDLDQLAKKSGQTAKEISDAFQGIKKSIDDSSNALQNEALKGLKGFREELGGIANNFSFISDGYGVFIREIKNGVSTLKGLNLPGILSPQDERSAAIQRTLNQAIRDGASAEQAMAAAAQAGGAAFDSAIRSNQQVIDSLSNRIKSLIALGIPFDRLVQSANNLNNAYSRLAPSAQAAQIAKGGESIDNTGALAEEAIKKLHALGNEFQQLALGTEIFNKAVAEELVKAFKGGANSVDELNSALAIFRLNQNISDGVTGGIEKLGIKIRDTNGKLRSAGDIFNEVIKKLAAMADETQKSRSALEIFGDKSESVLKLIESGFRGLSKSAAVAGESIGQLNRRISEDDPQRPEIAKLWKEEFDELVRSAQSLRTSFGFAMAEAFLPTLRRMRLELEDNFVGYQGTFDSFSKYLAGWTEDIINAFSFVRQNGVIQFVSQDQVSEGRKYLNDIAAGFIAFGELVSNIYNNVLKPIGSGIATVFGGLAETLNALFGTNLNAISLITVAVLAKITGGIRLMTAAFMLGRTLFAPFFTLLATGFAAVAPSMGAFVSASGAVLAVLTAIAIKIGAFLIGPIGLAAIAVGLAAGVIITYWDDIKKAFSAGADVVSQTFNSIVEFVGNLITAIKTKVLEIGSAVADGFSAAVQSVIDFATTLKDWVGGAVDWVIKKFKSIGSAIGSGLSKLFGISSANVAEAPQAPAKPQGGLDEAGNAEQLSRPYVEAYDKINSIISEDIPKAFLEGSNRIASLSATLASEVKAKFSESAETLNTALIETIDKIREAVNTFFGTQFGEAVSNGVSSAITSFSNLRESVISDLNAMIDKANELADALAAASSGGGSGGVAPNQSNGFARGGFVRGSGTGTSDSIPAWLSNGEFVIRAAAVRRYGLSFLSSLNGMRIAPRFKLGVPGFAAGGPVGNIASATSGAGGGAGGGLTLVLGGESFGGLSGPPDVMGRLERYASAQSMRSMGRKPSWYGGSR